MPRRKWQLIQVCAFSGLLYLMVPCLNQCNLDIKRKLRECRAQKCNPCFCAKSPLRSTGLQTSGFMQSRIWPTVQICVFSGLLFAIVSCLHQCNVDIKRKLRECRAPKCNPCFGAKSPLRTTGLQTSRFHAVPYMADSTNLRVFGVTFRHGTVFAPMQS